MIWTATALSSARSLVVTVFLARLFSVSDDHVLLCCIDIRPTNSANLFCCIAVAIVKRTMRPTEMSRRGLPSRYLMIRSISFGIGMIAFPSFAWETKPFRRNSRQEHGLGPYWNAMNRSKADDG